MLGNAGLVARRELEENVRTWSFWVGVLSFPAVLVVSILLSLLFAGAKDVRTYGVVDASGWLAAAVEEMAGGAAPDPTAAARALAEGDFDRAREHAETAARSARGQGYHRLEVPGTPQQQEAELQRRLAEGEVFAYIVLPADPAANDAAPARYVSKNLADQELLDWYADLATEAVQADRLEAASLDAELFHRIRDPLEFEVRKLGAGGEEEEVALQDRARQFAPIAFAYLLWFAVFGISQMLLTNTIEEKSNRLMEVLLSSVSPLELMAGKILGIAATGLVMISGWAIFLVTVVGLGPRLLGIDLGLDLKAIALDPLFGASFVVYFVLGYLLLAAVLVGIGSLCSNLKQAQNLLAPINIVLMVPLFALWPVNQDPNGTLAKILSFIPPFTPFVMMNRAAGPPQAWEYVATTVLLVISIAVALWAAAKIFRIGVLLSGQPPKPAEVLRWLRVPVAGLSAGPRGSGADRPAP